MRTAATTAAVVLEPAARAFVDAAGEFPYLFELGAAAGRQALTDIQAGDIDKPFVDVFHTAISGGPTGTVSIRILRPHGATTKSRLPVIVYMHGGGWVFGDHRTHDRLARELAANTGAALVLVNYTRAPEARFPIAIEQGYALLEWIHSRGDEQCLDGSRIAVAGDSVGANMATALTLMAKQRSGPSLAAQLLFYPVIDAGSATASSERFADGWHLRRDAMQWFWDQYVPDVSQRDDVTASPLRASVKQLGGLPPALIVTAEADVVRDEGEAYGAKLRRAGVDVTAVRYAGTIHDFVMLNALRETQAAGAAIDQGSRFLRRSLRCGSAPVVADARGFML